MEVAWLLALGVAFRLAGRLLGGSLGVVQGAWGGLKASEDPGGGVKVGLNNSLGHVMD